MMQDVLQGLVVLHSWGVIHRGVKPSTVQRQSDGRFVLTGFGIFEDIVKSDRQNLQQNPAQQNPALEKTRPELSNRQIEQGFHRDLYAVGLLALEMLSAAKDGANAAAAIGARDTSDSRSQSGLAQGIASPGLSAILERMLAPSPEHRYQSAAEVLETLRRLDNKRLASPSVTPHRFRQLLCLEGRRNRWSAGLTLAACVFGLTSVRLPQHLLSHYWLHQASGTLEQGEYQQAIALSSRAIRQGQAGAAYLQRGLAQYHLSRWDAAQRDLTQAIDAALQSEQAFYYRGGARSALGDHRGALADYTEAIRIARNPAEIYLKRGSVRSALGDKQGAIADYTLAIEQQPSSADAYSQRCLAYSDAGDHRQGLQDCSRAIDLIPSAVTAYQNRGLIRQRLGNIEEAIADLNLALRLDPQNADTYYTRGLIRLTGADEAGAIEDFTQAIAIAPSHDLAHYERGITRKQTGDLPGAKRDLEQAMTLCLEQGRHQCYEAAQAELAQPQLARPPHSIRTAPSAAAPLKVQAVSTKRCDLSCLPP